MPEAKVSPAVIIPIGLGLGLAAVVGIYALARAAPPTGVPWGYSDVQCPVGPSGIGVWYQVNFSAMITNDSEEPATKTVSLIWRRADLEGDWLTMKTIELTLAPGESYNFTSDPGSLLIYYDMTIECYLVDSDGGESAKCLAIM
ncbi:hypothetical protein ES703_77505 [subsurface metagenome]